MAAPQNCIGFMQGRLSGLVNGRIQTFPAENWKSEFEIAQKIQLSIIEWTIDTLTYPQNPLVNHSEIQEVKRISKKTNVGIPSVTCDYYMENPHWDSNNIDIEQDVIRIIEAMSLIQAHILVIPLVDNSSISKNQNADMNFFKNLEKDLRKNNVRIAFELDLAPEVTPGFIESFNPEWFGINYDVGNSASLGFNPVDEIVSYGRRILNVHVKDRLIGGNTVPLGMGNADFSTVIDELGKIHYSGNYIMQTARATDDDHAGELIRNINFFKRVLIER